MPRDDQGPLCKCGCGLPRTGEFSRYHGGHRRFVVVCRKRFNRLRWYAREKAIPFTITLEDVKNLFYPLPDLGESCHIERADITRGFAPDNLLVKRYAKTKPATAEVVASLRTASPEAIRTALEKILARRIKRHFGTAGCPVSMNDLVDIYCDQDGRCPITLVHLALTRLNRPESVEIARRDNTIEWSKKNTVLVAKMIQPAIDKWGLKPYLKAFKALAKKQRKADARGT